MTLDPGFALCKNATPLHYISYFQPTKLPPTTSWQILDPHLPGGGGLWPGGVPRQRTPWQRHPEQRPGQNPGQNPSPRQRPSWTYTPWKETPLDRDLRQDIPWIETPPSTENPPGQRPPAQRPRSPCWQTDTCENIILPQTSFAGCNNDNFLLPRYTWITYLVVCNDCDACWSYCLQRSGRTWRQVWSLSLSNCLHFHALYDNKILPNNRLASSSGVGAPSWKSWFRHWAGGLFRGNCQNRGLGNPGSSRAFHYIPPSLI